jgi:hypothetical protein
VDSIATAMDSKSGTMTAASVGSNSAAAEGVVNWPVWAATWQIGQFAGSLAVDFFFCAAVSGGAVNAWTSASMPVSEAGAKWIWLCVIWA